jgi:L-lactate dehydrogenase complex protein LldG
MEWALADTGSLAQNSTAIAQRLVSSLPTIHIALVPTSGILPDMPSLLARVNPKECAYLSMITGPSRTADIERVLTIGVHGPERLVIIFVDDLGGES